MQSSAARPQMRGDEGTRGAAKEMIMLEDASRVISDTLKNPSYASC